MLTLVQVITLVALAVYLLVRDPSVNNIASFVAGVGAVVWALLLVLPL